MKHNYQFDQMNRSLDRIASSLERLAGVVERTEVAVRMPLVYFARMFHKHA